MAVVDVTVYTELLALGRNPARGGVVRVLELFGCDAPQTNIPKKKLLPMQLVTDKYAPPASTAFPLQKKRKDEKKKHA
jgi:hypothetical protein